MKIQAFWLSASVLTLGWCGVAAAQTPATEDTVTNEEVVVVTAERRSTDLQRTPIAATVLTGERLANSGVTAVDQLQFVSPAATVNNFGQGIDFNIRGIGKAEHNSQTTTGVITYRDGVATFPGYFTAEPYYDIRSVEILRGPQGTFVGANATGGAVFVNSNDPVIGGGVSGYILGQAGNYNDFGGQGAVNLPISDTLAARVAFYTEQRDSFYTITGPGDHGDDGLQIGAVRASLLWQPTENFSLNFKTDFNYLDLSGYPADPVNATNDPFEITGNYPQKGIDRFVRTHLTANYEFGNGITLRSVTAYQEGNTAYSTDLDGTSAGNFTFGDSVDERIWSQEVNLISPDEGPITWVVGAYFQDEDLNFPAGKFYIGTPPPFFYTLQGHNLRDNTAVFGQVSFDLPARFQLQLGARYSESTTTNHISVNQYGTPITQNQREEFSNLSGKVSLNWIVDDHNFLYAFAATGFRPGGLNVPVSTAFALDSFDEETVTSYEVGWKAGFFDGHIRTQIDAYYTEYDNFQVIVRYPTFPTFSFELNNPNTTTMSGFEAQVEAVFGDFSLDAGLGIMESELGTFFATDQRVTGVTLCDPLSGPASITCIDLTGKDQTYAPELTFNVGAQYDFQLSSDDTLTPRLNYGHVSEQWATLFENEALGDRVEARNVWNGQIAWRHGSIVTTLYGTNLGDQHYVAAVNSGLRFMGAPRQYGIRVFKAF
jgi:iron complex outermembrane receptor protein